MTRGSCAENGASARGEEKARIRHPMATSGQKGTLRLTQRRMPTPCTARNDLPRTLVADCAFVALERWFPRRNAVAHLRQESSRAPAHRDRACPRATPLRSGSPRLQQVRRPTQMPSTHAFHHEHSAGGGVTRDAVFMPWVSSRTPNRDSPETLRIGSRPRYLRRGRGLADSHGAITAPDTTKAPTRPA